jgi:hypothetical protein
MPYDKRTNGWSWSIYGLRVKTTMNEEIQSQCITVNIAFKYGAENGCLWLSDKRRF